MIRLNPRQYQVWVLTARGLPVKAIAAELGISKATTCAYRSTLFAELGVDCAIKAGLLAVVYGVITLGRRDGRITVAKAKKPKRPASSWQRPRGQRGRFARSR